MVFFEGWLKVNSLHILSVEVGNKYASWILALIQRKATKLRRPAFFNKEECEHLENSKSYSIEKEMSHLLKNESQAQKKETKYQANDLTLIGNDLMAQLEHLSWFVYLPQNIVGLIAGVSTIV